MAKKKTISKKTVKQVNKAAKRNPKAAAIIGIIAIVVIAGAIGGYFVYKKLNPEMTFKLVGGNVQSIGLDSNYVEKGVKATYRGEDISKEVNIKYFEGTGTSKTEIAAITTEEIKSYTVTYSIQHEKLDKTLERVVNVVDVAPMEINFLELGNYHTGDCTYIKAGDVDILIDAGSIESSAETISAFLNQPGNVDDGKIEYLVVTHAHQDHIAGLVGTSSIPGIFDAYEVENIIQFAKTNSTTQLYNKYLAKRDAEVEAGANLYLADKVANEVFDIAPGITMTVLDQRYYYESSSDENNYSVCTLFSQADNNYLFTGDLEKEGEESLVERNSLPKCELFKGGHHGSKTSNNECLLSVIQPEVVCVCCCAGNDEYTKNVDNQFPTQDAINRIAVYTKQIYVTTVTTDGHNGFTSMNGDISFICLHGQEYSIDCSNNNTILKDSDWFKANRTWPSTGVQ